MRVFKKRRGMIVPISKNKGSSWYTSRSKPIDLFVGPSTTRLLPPQPSLPSEPGYAQPVVPVPFILGSSANLLFTQPVQGGEGEKRSALPLAVPRRSPVDRQSWEPGAGLEQLGEIHQVSWPLLTSRKFTRLILLQILEVLSPVQTARETLSL